MNYFNSYNMNNEFFDYDDNAILQGSNPSVFTRKWSR